MAFMGSPLVVNVNITVDGLVLTLVLGLVGAGFRLCSNHGHVDNLPNESRLFLTFLIPVLNVLCSLSLSFSRCVFNHIL